MTDKKPYISVVIPALNEEKYIRNCLDSFRKQSFIDFEILVIDGGSKDNTISIAKKYGAKVFSLSGSNICQARQRGLKEASGEIYVGADADNIYPKDHLQRIADNFVKYKDAVAVVGGGIFEKNPAWTYYLWRLIYFLINLFYRLTGYVLYAPAFNISYKKDVFLKIGGYTTYLDYGGDELDVLSRLRRVGKIIFDNKLNSYASSRRTREGILKAFFLHLIFYYYLSYLLAKIFKRTIIKGQGVR